MGVWLFPWRWYILSIPLKARRGISAKTCGLDDVFSPDDLGSGPCTPFIIYIPHIIATFLLSKNILPKRYTYQKLVWPCWCIGWFDTVWFQACFQLYVPVFSMSWYRYRYLWHCALVSSTPWLYSQWDCFWVYVVLVLNVIRYTCYYFLDMILFHHDFHHDCCDSHWDFYGH